MPKKIDLLNQKIGKLLVIEETNKRKNKSIVWKCLCDCGNIEEFSTKELRSDGIIQCHKCGKNRKPQTNLTENIVGKKFNHLTVLEKSDKRIGGKIGYKCQCDCKDYNIIYVTKTDLEKGYTKSCGCRKLKGRIGDIINNREIIDYSNSFFEKSQKGTYYKVRCLLCGREYLATFNTLTRTISCGCQKSIGEFNIAKILKDNNISFIKEYKFPDSLLRYDFAILDLNNNIVRLIEFDGEQHYINHVKKTGWSSEINYQKTVEHDLIKNQMAINNHIPLARIPYWERHNINLEMLFDKKYEIKNTL